jgi:hypothetical protein
MKKQLTKDDKTILDLPQITPAARMSWNVECKRTISAPLPGSKEKGRMKHDWHALVLVLILAMAFGWCAVPSSVLAQTSPQVQNLFNTGVNSSGAVLPNGTIGDLHYSLILVPGGTTNTIIKTSAGGAPIGPWLGDNGGSAWIGPHNTFSYANSGIDGYAGTYDYQTTFTLAASGSFTISGQWSADNHGVDIRIDGQSTGNATFTGGAGDWTQWTPFSITASESAGVQTLDFIVLNSQSSFPPDYGSPTGLRVEFFPVPEPSTLALIILGSAAVATRRRYIN